MSPSPYQSKEEAKISRINAAGIINITIENLWRDCHSAMAKNDYSLWNKKLDAIWTILGGDVKEGDTEDKKMNDLDLKIYETGNLNHNKSGFKTISKEESKKMAFQYQYLKKKSLILRRLQNSQGKGTAYHDEDNDDMS